MAMVSLQFSVEGHQNWKTTLYCISNVIDVKTEGKLNIGDSEMKLLKTCNQVWLHMPVIPIFGGERPRIWSLRPGSTSL